ncbi:MAG TPA: ABC transporter permease [Vicinamibacterales bacterium]|nr:ABC transporter permease [Vicinamibacterales bacterium]
MRTLRAVATKELHQILRDRRTLMILLFVPAVILLLYGYALNFDIRDIRLAVQDRDRSTESRRLISAFVNSGYFQLIGYEDGEAALAAMIDRNEVRAVLVIPPQFGRTLAGGRAETVQMVIDGDNANTASTVVGYAQAIVAEFSSAVAVARMTQVNPASQPASLSLESRIWYNPQLRSTLFLVPGLIAFISMITAVVSTALSVVREKERGTMEQIRMSPIGSVAFILGKSLPYLVLSFISALLIVFAARLLFDMPMRGSWLILCISIALFLIGAQGQGLLVSTFASSQQVAFQAALLSSFLPTFILSGFIFPLTSMPVAIQWISRIVPARYFLVILRAVVLKGAGVGAFWEELVALAIFSTLTLGLASLRLRREWA